MAFLLVWRTAGPWYPASDPRCRRIIEARDADTYTHQEHATFQVVERPGLAADVRPYHAVNADAPTGAILLLDPADAPKRFIRVINAPDVETPYTLAEMQAGVV